MADAVLGRSKYPDEEFIIAWDFIDDLDDDDSLAAVGVSGSRVEATDQDGTDVSATVLEATALGDPSSRVLKVRLKAGTAGDDLEIRFIGVTANGSQFERVLGVRVRA